MGPTKSARAQLGTLKPVCSYAEQGIRAGRPRFRILTSKERAKTALWRLDFEKTIAFALRRSLPRSLDRKKLIEIKRVGRILRRNRHRSDFSGN